MQRHIPPALRRSNHDDYAAYSPMSAQPNAQPDTPPNAQPNTRLSTKLNTRLNTRLNTQPKAQLKTQRIRRGLSTLAALSASLALDTAGSTRPAEASAQYCHMNSDGQIACIHQVFGPRNYRGLIFTVNGYYYQVRYNCYDYDYHPTSIRSVACWAYEAAKDTGVASHPPTKEATPALLKSLAEAGKPTPGNSLTPEQIRSKIPPEMR